MTSEVELRALAEKHGYKLLGVKRFRVKGSDNASGGWRGKK